MSAPLYCVRDFKGQYLTHTVDLRTGTSTLWFTPSPWMAYCSEDRTIIETLARCEGGTVEVWEAPAPSSRPRQGVPLMP